MGITGFATMLKACAPKHRIVDSIRAASPGSTVLCVDMACVIMAALQCERGSEEFHQDPPFPAHHVSKACVQFIRKLAKMNFGVIAVSDGIPAIR